MQGVFVCVKDSRLRVWRLSTGFENGSNAKLRCHYAFCDRQRSPVFFYAAGCVLHVHFLPSSRARSHSPPPCSFLESLLHPTFSS